MQEKDEFIFEYLSSWSCRSEQLSAEVSAKFLGYSRVVDPIWDEVSRCQRVCCQGCV